jgi:hypothetical protein
MQSLRAATVLPSIGWMDKKADLQRSLRLADQVLMLRNGD